MMRILIKALRQRPNQQCRAAVKLYPSQPLQILSTLESFNKNLGPVGILEQDEYIKNTLSLPLSMSTV